MSTAIVPRLTAAEARELTERIKAHAGELCSLLLEAHEGKAWKALGYESWREYATAEFDMSQSHAYRLMDQGRVIAAIAEAAGGNSPVGEITEREARDIKLALPEVTAEIKQRVQAGEEPAQAVKEVVAAKREPAPAPQLVRDEPKAEQPEPAHIIGGMRAEHERSANGQVARYTEALSRITPPKVNGHPHLTETQHATIKLHMAALKMILAANGKGARNAIG